MAKHKYECCRCNGKGLCLRCSCVRSGTPCTSCLPLRKGHCQNAGSGPLRAVVCAAQSHSQSTMLLSNGQQPTSTASLSSSSQPLLCGDTPSPPSHSLSSCEAPLSSASDYVVPSSHRLPCLPIPSPVSEATFVWGKLDSSSACRLLSDIYSETVHWRKYYFTIPFGHCGKSFVSELARLFRAFAEGSALELVALKAVSVACILLLQRPHSRSKPKDNSTCLTRRLKLWREGEFEELLAEGRALQQKLFSQRRKPITGSTLARSFTKLMWQGRTTAAVRLLTGSDSGRVLQANDPVIPGAADTPTVLDVLRSKHPPPQPSTPEALLSPGLEPPQAHPIIYEAIDARYVRLAALKTSGAGGPSGTDAHCW